MARTSHVTHAHDTTHADGTLERTLVTRTHTYTTLVFPDGGVLTESRPNAPAPTPTAIRTYRPGTATPEPERDYSVMTRVELNRERIPWRPDDAQVICAQPVPEPTEWLVGTARPAKARGVERIVPRGQARRPVSLTGFPPERMHKYAR